MKIFLPEDLHELEDCEEIPFVEESETIPFEALSTVSHSEIVVSPKDKSIDVDKIANIFSKFDALEAISKDNALVKIRSEGAVEVAALRFFNAVDVIQKRILP